MYSKLQYISQGRTALEQEKNICNALQWGVDWIQLRWKEGNHIEFIDLAFKISEICKQYQAILIINDHVDIAKHIDADGVHLGLDDCDISSARYILGKEKIIGATANTLVDIQKNIAQGCNYIGLGPFRYTKTKIKLSPILGLQGYKLLLGALCKNESLIPIYAIGGITMEDLDYIRSTGIYGIASSSMINNNPSIISEIKLKLQ